MNTQLSNSSHMAGIEENIDGNVKTCLTNSNRKSAFFHALIKTTRYVWLISADSGVKILHSVLPPHPPPPAVPACRTHFSSHTL